MLAHWHFGDRKIVQSYRVTRSENSAKVSCVICWSNRSGWNSRFLANLLDGNVLFVLEKRNVFRYSSLKARVKTMHGKWISQTFLTDHSNQVRHTNRFSCHKRFCFHSFCINYLLFFEMYYIYKEQAYLAALEPANRLSQSNTILDKTTWESFPHHVHSPTQQNYFQNDAFAERKPLPPIQCCFPQAPRDQAFFWIHNNIAFRGRGRGKNRYSYDV